MEKKRPKAFNIVQPIHHGADERWYFFVATTVQLIYTMFYIEN